MIQLTKSKDKLLLRGAPIRTEGVTDLKVTYAGQTYEIKPASAYDRATILPENIDPDWSAFNDGIYYIHLLLGDGSAHSYWTFLPFHTEIILANNPCCSPDPWALHDALLVAECNQNDACSQYEPEEVEKLFYRYLEMVRLVCVNSSAKTADCGCH